MISKIKVLGFAILAIAAMSMIGASAAQAANGELHAEVTGGSADLTGEQLAGGQHNFKLTTSGLETHCTEAKFESTITDEQKNAKGELEENQTQVTATEGTITGRYTGCQSTGPFSAAATVKMNGCKYTITGNQATALTAKVDIAGCTTGKKIEITTEGCTVTVGEQGPLGTMTFTNIAEKQDEPEPKKFVQTPKHVGVTLAVQGIQYQTEGGFCILGSQQHSDGDYTGTATFRAFSDQKTTTQVTHNGHQYNEIICGSEKGLFAT